MTSSLSGEVSLLKIDYFSFGSPGSAPSVSKPTFGTEATEDKNYIFTPMLSGPGKTSYPLVFWLQAPFQKLALVGLLLIPA